MQRPITINLSWEYIHLICLLIYYLFNHKTLLIDNLHFMSYIIYNHNSYLYSLTVTQ